MFSDYDVEDEELDLYEKAENAGDGMGNSLLRESILGKTFKIIAKVNCWRLQAVYPGGCF